MNLAWNLRLTDLLGPVLLGCILSLGSAGCIEPFGGSSLQITFDEGVPAAARPGTTPPFGTPPPNTFMSFYAVEFVFTRDENGDIVNDGTGNPVIEDSFSFHVTDFEIQPLLNTESPCFIEKDNTNFPGLHVTQVYDKLRAETGIDDPRDPPADADDNDVIDLLTAERRVQLLGQLEDQVKAVTSTTGAQYPELGTACMDAGGDPTLIPPPTCIDESSNATRLAVCEQFWLDNPDLYEGNDKVFTIPLNGSFFGSVTGLNPINNGMVSGAGFFVDEVLRDIDALVINWQYKDLDGDGEPDFPDDLPDAERSNTGFLFMQGVPISKTRGVINVPLSNPDVSVISGEAVIFPNLDEDDVNF